MKFVLKNIYLLVGILLGAMAGFLYWKFVGCESGNCAITSSPINSTIYGSVMGGLISSSFKKKEETQKSGAN